jgi:hypothetical protein
MGDAIAPRTNAASITTFRREGIFFCLVLVFFALWAAWEGRWQAQVRVFDRLPRLRKLGERWAYKWTF